MDFAEVIREYFRGERLTGLVLIPLGLAALAFAVYLWRVHSGGLVMGLLVTLGVAGAGFVAGGAFLASRSHSQIKELPELYSRAPGDFVAAERPRMTRVNANWPRIKMAWAALILISLATLGFVPTEWLRGVALGLLILCGLLMTVDTLAERRAEVYTAALLTAPPLS